MNNLGIQVGNLEAQIGNLELQMGNLEVLPTWGNTSMYLPSRM